MDNIFNPALIGPDAYAQQLSLQRQQQLADLLTQQGTTPIDPTRHAGGVNGGAGYVVPISPVEGLAKLGQALGGALMQRGLNQRQAALQSQAYSTLQQRLAAALGGGQAPQSAPQSVGSDGGPVTTTSQSDGGPVSAPQTAPAPNPAAGDPSRLTNMVMLEQAGIKLPDAVVAAALPTNEYRNVGLPTPEARNAQYATGNNDPAARQLLLSKMLKEGTIQSRPNETVMIPGQRPQIAPDPGSGIATNVGPNGELSQYAIPGAANSRADIAGQVEAAKTGSAYVPMGTSTNGATIYGQPGHGAAVVPQAASPRAPQVVGQGGAPTAQLAPRTAFLSPEEKARQEGAGKNFSDYEQGLNARVSTGQAIINRTNTILPLLDQFKTGSAGADTRLELARVAKTMGADQLSSRIAGGDLAAGEELKKMFLQGALATLKSDLSTSNGKQDPVRVSEFQTYLEANPGLENQPDMIRHVLDWYGKNYQKDFAEQQALLQARQKGTLNPATWQAQYSATRDGQLKAEKPQASAYPEGATATNPQNGQKLVHRNGQWVPQ